jgi:anti-sigma-K factor RskA
MKSEARKRLTRHLGCAGPRTHTPSTRKVALWVITLSFLRISLVVVIVVVVVVVAYLLVADQQTRWIWS